MEWTYEPAADLDQVLTARLRNFPREPEILVYSLRSLAAVFMRLWLRAVHRLHISGPALPAGSCILVANHSSHLDALCLQAAVPLRRLHRVFPAAAQDYFFCSLPRTLFAAIFVNALPFSRRTHVRQSLALCRALLESPGNILILFPEGTRSPDGTIQPFRPGIGALVGGLSVPVIPCRIEGTAHAWPKGARFPRPGRLAVRLGCPISFADAGTGKEDQLRIARALQCAVEDLGRGTD